MSRADGIALAATAPFALFLGKRRRRWHDRIEMRHARPEGGAAGAAVPAARSGADAAADRKAIAAVKTGDRPALAELYDRYARQMLGVAYRILGNRRDAEDLLHDVFIEAWQRAGSYDERRGSVRAWLLLRVRSRAVDRVRALAVAQQHAMARAHEGRGRDAADDQPDRAADGARARRALQGLSEEQRSAVQLAYFEGQTCREIAARCEIPVGTVKSRLSAAIANLRKQLADDEGAR